VSQESGQRTSTSQTATEGEPLGWLIERDSRRRGLGRLLGLLVELPVLGRPIARMTRAPITVRFLSTRVTRLHAMLLRLSRGRLRRSWVFAGGQPVLALTTTGRRTGQPRTTAVACFVHEENLVIAAMNLGVQRLPAWALNLQANPNAIVDVGGHRLPVRARPACGNEARALWQRWVELQPSASAFQDIAGRRIPLFVLNPLP
jgi:deazaflavin-dependent oxidoreductase (nitroreductase family)